MFRAALLHRCNVRRVYDNACTVQLQGLEGQALVLSRSPWHSMAVVFMGFGGQGLPPRTLSEATVLEPAALGSVAHLDTLLF